MKPTRYLIPAALGAVILTASAMPAQAGSSFHLGINAAPVYYQPAPVYYAPPPVYYTAPPVYYRPVTYVRYHGWDRHHDWGYGKKKRGHHGHGRWHRHH